MSAVAVSNERSFVATYSQLVRLSPQMPADAFYSTENYRKLASLGPTLPKINRPLPRKGKTVTSEKTTDVTFKSIKPPFKFSAALQRVPLSQTVYKLKNDLIVAVPELKAAGVTSANLKLMVKAKVVQDSSVLGALPVSEAGLSFMVMVSPPAPEVIAQDPVDAAVLSIDAPAPAVISPSTWTKIHAVLEEDLGQMGAKSALTRLQNGWNH